MSIKLVVTRGYGNGAFEGTIKGVTLRGYDIGGAVIGPVPPVAVPPPVVGVPSPVSTNFLGSGILMYSKDNSYYILNPEENTDSVTSAIEKNTIELIMQKEILELELKLLNARIEEAYETKINREDI